MSKSLEFRKIRCSDVLKQFLSGSSEVIFLTLTTKDVVDIVEIRSRWRSFRHWLVERFNPRYIMNYEVHPRGHGWHIHCVVTCYIPLPGYLSTIQSYGFGRVNVKRVNDVFVAEYLAKHCLKAYRGSNLRGSAKRIRLVNQSRGLPVLSDYRYRSEFLDHVRKMFLSVRSQSSFFSSRISAYWFSLPFRLRFKLCELAVLCDISEFVFDSFLRDVLDHRFSLFQK